MPCDRHCYGGIGGIYRASVIGTYRGSVLVAVLGEMWHEGNVDIPALISHFQKLGVTYLLHNFRKLLRWHRHVKAVKKVTHP